MGNRGRVRVTVDDRVRHTVFSVQQLATSSMGSGLTFRQLVTKGESVISSHLTLFRKRRSS